MCNVDLEGAINFNCVNVKYASGGFVSATCLYNNLKNAAALCDSSGNDP